ncbi:MAG: hypothetical protein ACXWFG_09920, partial [Methylobacter sp.]
MYKPVQDRYLIMDVDLDVGRHTHRAQVRPSKALLSKAEGCVARGGVAYRDVGKEREPGAISFTAEIVTQANNKIRALISLTALASRTPNKTDIVLLIQESSSEYLSAESAFVESEERFRQMAEMTGEWLWEQDPNGYYSYSSNAVTQILGYRPD